MKKFLFISHFLFALFYGPVLYAVEPATKVAILHTIANNSKNNVINYELVDPTGITHNGTLKTQSVFYSPTKTFKFDSQDLYGPYILHYQSCGLWISSCVSFTQIVVVTKNEQVLWSISEEGILDVTEKDL